MGEKLRGMARYCQGVMTHLVTTQESISERDVDRAHRLFLIDGVSAMAMLTLQGGVFLIGFAIAMGASNYEIGMLTTIAFLGQFAQLIGLGWIKLWPKRRAIMVLCAAASRLLWLMIVIAPFIFARRGFGFVLMWLVVLTAVGAIAGPPWNSLFRDLVPEKRRGRLLSRRLLIGTSLGLALTLSGGWFIDWWRRHFANEAYGYSLLFLGGLLFGLLGVWALSRLPEPRLIDEQQAPLRKQLVKPLKDPNFRQLLWWVCIWSFAVNMAAPFFVVYMIEGLELSLFLVTVFAVTSQLSNILFLNVWVRLTEKFGNKPVLGVSGTLFLVAILAWAFTRMPNPYVLTLPIVLLIHVLSGMSVAGVAISSSNIALKLSPRGEGHSYMTAFGLAAAVTGAIAPLVGGLLGDFFAPRDAAPARFGIPLEWSAQGAEKSLYVVSLTGFDFVFVIAFLLGLWSLRRLRSVIEEGEATEEAVREELVQELVSPLRSLSTESGVRRLLFLPLVAVSRTVSKVKEQTVDRILDSTAGEREDGDDRT